MSLEPQSDPPQLIHVQLEDSLLQVSIVSQPEFVLVPEELVLKHKVTV